MVGTATEQDTNKLISTAITEVGEIATLPEVTVRIIQIVENPKSTARDLHDVIRNDPALSARILKVVNSAFYGLPGQIASVDRAIVLLGLSAVKNIAIAASMTRLFSGSGSIEGFNPMELWRHSVAVAVACRMLTATQGRPSVEESFLGGLIHDLGLLIERQAFPRKLAEVLSRYRAEPRNFCAIETEVIGADHPAFGMALASKWRFPRPLCTAIGYHHKPLAVAAEFRELPALVHVADVLACRAGIGFTATAALDQIDPSLLGLLHVEQAHLDEIMVKLPEQVHVAETMFQG